MRLTIARSVPESAVDDGLGSPAWGGRRRFSTSRARRSATAVTAAAAVVAIALAGCSDSDGDTETSVASKSAPEVPETIAATATISAEEASAESATPEPASESATPEPASESAAPEPTASSGPISVAEADIEAALAKDLEAQAGVQFSVDCPGDLVAVAGTQMHCTTVLSTGEVYNVDMTVTSVEGGRLIYSMEARPAA